MSLEPAALGAAQLADAIVMSPSAWMVVLAESMHLQSARALLEVELRESLSESDGGQVLRVDLRSGIEALDQIVAADPRDVALVDGWEDFEVRGFQWLDAHRNAFLGARLVVLCTEAAAGRLRTHAPNVWSWIGGRCFLLEETTGKMDVPERLRSLRASYGYDDVEVARRVAAGELSLDPVITEWLILSGRGDLVGR